MHGSSEAIEADIRGLADSKFLDAVVLQLAVKDIKVSNADEKIKEFNKLHHDHLRYMYAADDINQIMDSLKNPIRVKDQVYRVAGQDELGKKLFGDTLLVLLSQETSKIIRDEVKGRLHGQGFDCGFEKSVHQGGS